VVKSIDLSCLMCKATSIWQYPRRRKIRNGAEARQGASGSAKRSGALRWSGGSKLDLLFGGAFGAGGKMESQLGVLGFH